MGIRTKAAAAPLRVVRDLTPLILLASWPFVAFLAANKEQILRVEAVMIAWGAYLVAMAGGDRRVGENGGTRPRAVEKSPNVYWFLLDGYVRDDSLKRYFAYDNEHFLRFLRDRGFQIARASHANYDNTAIFAQHDTEHGIPLPPR